MIKFSVLASGSTGNAIYIGTNNINLLVDAGLSGKKIEASLQEIGLSLKMIDGILLTHEHVDHVRGIGVLARKYKIPIYANFSTLTNLPKSVGNIEDSYKKTFATGAQLQLADLLVENFPISHDAVEPVGYIFRNGELKLSIATDLGYVSQKIKDKIRASNILIFEANHDVGMLRMSSYPWSVKQRILSDVGHLSNEAAGEALVELITEETEKVYLAHLSKENNLQELARLAVKNILTENGISEDKTKIMDTYPNKPTKLQILSSNKREFALG